MQLTVYKLSYKGNSHPSWSSSVPPSSVSTPSPMTPSREGPNQGGRGSVSSSNAGTPFPAASPASQMSSGPSFCKFSYKFLCYDILQRNLFYSLSRLFLTRLFSIRCLNFFFILLIFFHPGNPPEPSNGPRSIGSYPRQPSVSSTSSSASGLLCRHPRKFPAFFSLFLNTC